MTNFDYKKFLAEGKLYELDSPSLTSDQVEMVAQQVADKFSTTDELGIKYTITPDSVEADPRGAGFDLDAMAGPNTPGDDWKDENGFTIDNYLGKYAGGSYIIKMENGKYNIYNAANRNAYIGYITPQGEVVFEIPGFEGTMDQLNSLEEEKPKTKMKKSELKEIIKAAIMAEAELNVNTTAQNPENEEDFLAEADEEVDAETADVAVDTPEGDAEIETTDVETTAEVNPNVKAVQDSLTQAQAAAKALGDAKLTDQIGNTITFFTRTHVASVDKEVAEAVIDAASGDEGAEDVTSINPQSAAEIGMEENLNESMFPMLKKILK